MTINSLQFNTSTVVGGLGTQTYNVTAATAGLLTVSFKTFIPYLAIGGQPVTSNPVAEIQTVTTVADSSGSLNSTYFTAYSADNYQGFYVWYNINSAGVDPAPAGLTGIQVTGATGATANTLATATRAAILANTAAAGLFSVGGATNAVILTNKNTGQATAAADGTAPTGFTFAVGTAGTFGVPATSGVVVTISQGSTVLGRWGFPSPTQPIIGGSVVIQGATNDVITVVLSSLSTADAGLNAVKSIINVFGGVGT